jgi:hypothetical protein
LPRESLASSGKRAAAAPPALTLHAAMPKADLDAFLKKCGASQPNPFSVEEVFGAVTSAMWDAVIVPKLEFRVDEEAVSKVRLAIDRARVASKKTPVTIEEEKEKDADVVAAVEAHKAACAKAGIETPFLSDGRAVDAKGVAVKQFSFAMLDGKGKAKAKAKEKLSVAQQAVEQQKEDKANPNVLRVSKPKSTKGWQFRADPKWAMANLDRIAQFLGDQEEDAEGNLIPCEWRHEQAVMEGSKVVVEEHIFFKISNARKTQLKTLERPKGFKTGYKETPIDFDRDRGATGGELGLLGTVVSALQMHLEDTRIIKEGKAANDELSKYASAADVYDEQVLVAQRIRAQYAEKLAQLQTQIDEAHTGCTTAMAGGDMASVIKLGQQEIEHVCRDSNSGLLRCCLAHLA